MKTTLTQTSSSFTDDTGALHFQIQNTLSNLAAGDLPYLEIFLFQIVVAVDPKADVFLRISGLADISATIPRSRDAALASGASIYAAAGFTILFDDLATAVQGKQVIQARIDDLITNWKLFQEQFVNPSSASLPLADSSSVAAAKASLVNALKNRDTAATTSDSLVIASAAAQAAAAAAKTALADAQELADTAAQFSTQYTIVKSDLFDYRGSNDALLSAALLFLKQAQDHQTAFPGDAGFPPQISAFAAAVTAGSNASVIAKGDLGPLTDNLATKLAQQVATTASKLQAALTAKRTADAAASDAQTKATLAEAALTAAQASADAALVTVTNFCPNFDPATDL